MSDKPTNIEYDDTKKSFSSELTGTQIDAEFKSLAEFIRARSFDEIKSAITQNLNYLKSTNPGLYNNVINYYNRFSSLWGKYYPDDDDFELVDNRATAFYEHIDDFEWFFNTLQDNRSKKIFNNILYYWLMSDSKRIEKIADYTFEQYFDLDIVTCNKDEIFVDIGAYIGDTLISYSNVFGKACFKNIYCYEIVPSNIEYIEKNIKIFDLDNVIIREKGASSKSDIMYISSDETSSINQLSDNGILAVPTVKIDDDIDGEVTFIKMDIEGGEEEALLGCLEKIKKYHPKLALSVYHNHKDLWKLARIIYDADPSYKFYLRYYGGPILPTEYLIYAI